MKNGTIFNIQHFSSEDGPGIRTTVFLKGCNLRCPWCHNPESQSFHKEIMRFEAKCIGCGRCVAVCPQAAMRKDAAEPDRETAALKAAQQPVLFSGECLHCGKCAEVCPAEALICYGKEMTAEQAAEEVLQDKDMYEFSGGGTTFSGGEPLLQAEFLEEVLKILKKEGIHTAIETAGCYETGRLERILPYTDLVFMDLKCLDEQKHGRVIGAPNGQILENIRFVSDQNVDFVIRIPVICGFNDMELPQMAKFVKTLPEHVRVELLPYHEICSGKYDALCRNFAVEGYRVPAQAEMDRFKALFGERIL